MGCCNTGRLVKSLIGHNNGVWSVAFSPDGKVLASGSVDKSIKLWNVANGQLIKSLIGHTDEVRPSRFRRMRKVSLREVLTILLSYGM